MICEALRSDRFGRPVEAERAVEARAACSGFPHADQEAPDNADDYHWAVRLMIEASLLEVKEDRAEPFSRNDLTGPDDWVWALREKMISHELQPRQLLRSTPEPGTR